MAGMIELDGEHYDRGSIEHLEKIDSLHKSEISKQTEAYVQDLTQLKDLEVRARVIHEELEDGVREQSLALADANEATQQSEDRFRLLVNGVKDHALLVTGWRGRARPPRFARPGSKRASAFEPKAYQQPGIRSSTSSPQRSRHSAAPRARPSRGRSRPCRTALRIHRWPHCSRSPIFQP